MKLKDFIRKCGGMEKAARQIGCNYATVWRLKVGRGQPSDLLKIRLQELGIEISREGK